MYNIPSSTPPEVAVLVQQLANVQYQLQWYQSQNGQFTQQMYAQQQEIYRLQARIRDVERSNQTYSEKYNNAKGHIANLQRQIDALKADVRRKVDEVEEYVEKERRSIKREQQRKQPSVWGNAPRQSEGSAYKDPPPRIGQIIQDKPSPPGTPTPAQKPSGHSDRLRPYQTVNPPTMADLSASFGGMNMMGGSNNDRRVASYNSLFSAPAVANESIQNSARAFMDNCDVFGPTPPLKLRASQTHSGLTDQGWETEELPEDVPGTIAFAEKMLVKFQSRDDRLEDIGKEFDALMSMILGWTEAYAKTSGSVQLRGENGIKSPDDVRRWKLMMYCMHPVQGHDAEKLMLSLASGQQFVYILTAMIWKYIQKRVLTPQVLLGMMPKTMENVVQVDEELRRTRPADIAPERRARMMAIRNKAVYDILQDVKYPAFRKSKVKEMIQELRVYMLPFLAPRPSISHTKAGEDLINIGLKAFDLLGKTMTENGLFVFHVPDVGARFQPSTMKLVKYHREAPSKMFGIKLKLCVAAGITFRDDTAGNIYTKQTNKALVLLEDPLYPSAAPQ